MNGYSIKDVISDIKQDINAKKMEKTAGLVQETKEEDVNLEDLGIKISKIDGMQEGITKVASALNKIDSMEELIKVAEEAGQTDIANLVKIADVIGDKIADRVIAKIKTV